jgi:hypothetical protein
MSARIPGTINITMCRTCSNLISEAKAILVDRASRGSGSREEWFYCPNCWYATVIIRHQSLQAKSLLQQLESKSLTQANELGVNS